MANYNKKLISFKLKTHEYEKTNYPVCISLGYY